MRNTLPRSGTGLTESCRYLAVLEMTSLSLFVANVVFSLRYCFFEYRLCDLCNHGAKTTPLSLRISLLCYEPLVEEDDCGNTLS